MTHKFLLYTDEGIQQMLDRIGIKKLEDLYIEVPESIRFEGDCDILKIMSKLGICAFSEKLGQKNGKLTCFVGGGVCDHYAPSAIQNLLSRSEFLTSYTPYQAGISQGALHYIFEFQNIMAELIGTDTASASAYEGITVSTEATMVALDNTKKVDTVSYSETLRKNIIGVLKICAHFHGVKLKAIKVVGEETLREDLKSQLQADGVAGVIV